MQNWSPSWKCEVPFQEVAEWGEVKASNSSLMRKWSTRWKCKVLTWGRPAKCLTQIWSRFTVISRGSSLASLDSKSIIVSRISFYYPESIKFYMFWSFSGVKVNISLSVFYLQKTEKKELGQRHAKLPWIYIWITLWQEKELGLLWISDIAT